MNSTSGDRTILGPNAQNLLRILIASYFLAGAIGLFPGTNLTPLTDTLLPSFLAGPAAACIVFILAYLVMIGVWLRGAALTLGILTFWASYLRMIELGLETELGVFWRDLALIASLMLTYAEPSPQAVRHRAVLSWKRRRSVQPRRIKPKQVERVEEKATSLDSSYHPYEAAYGHEKLSIEEMQQLFHDDFKAVRSN